ncbi:MAG: Zn-ribbon domain-containing OB-fold protein [Candidatus Thorarchaeota archaeon]
MKIQASRCTKCVRAIVPPRETCPYCGLGAGVMESIELDGQGTIVSFTTLHIPPEGFEPPLMMALVELQYGAVVLCLAKYRNEAVIEIGDSVSLSLDSEMRLQFQSIA